MNFSGDYEVKHGPSLQEILNFFADAYRDISEYHVVKIQDSQKVITTNDWKITSVKIDPKNHEIVNIEGCLLIRFSTDHKDDFLTKSKNERLYYFSSKYNPKIGKGEITLRKKP